MQLQNEPVRPREINGNIAEGLEEIIIRAMQKNVIDRYQSANEMLTDINAYRSNPAIIFGYSFSEVKAPVMPEPAVKPVSGAVYAEPEEVELVDENEFDDEFDFDDKNKKRTIAILSSVLAALVVFAVALIVMFAPSSDKISVPNLIGLDFYSEVMNSSQYAEFSFEPIIDYDSEEEAGTIIRQEPSSGKIDKNSSIIIYISGMESTVKVPDVYGYESTSASNVLKSKGFDVRIEKEFSDEELGTVIRTSPAKNKEVQKGSTVVIYVATNEEIEPVEVPNLVGLTIAQAKAKLSEVGLYLDSSRTEYRASAEPMGKIIGHELIGETVKPGTSIAVYVSTGKLPEEEEESTDESTDESSEDTTEKTTKPTTTKRPTTEPSTNEPTTEPVTEPSTTEPTTTEPTTDDTTDAVAPTDDSSDDNGEFYALDDYED